MTRNMQSRNQRGIIKFKITSTIGECSNLLNKITAKAESIKENNNNLREVNYALSKSINLAFEKRNLQNEKQFYTVNQLLVYERVDFVYNEFIDKTDHNLELNRDVQNYSRKLESLHQELYGNYGLGY
ncbi:unnamed protein product (macronuclear) [Paramecium tetraurelia]|uniref:Uncharacterized protein n=1 Tax=Paramecium tetraurelia TaxID=5888 RepID=A0EEH5_PARTE|nr:uncharacterized protein GSPATT00026038001 [Paramecium tetraurelia]CAK93703.1 unnamed protein product [Paramecium tetraurelia]|eukprot:XP_001461089.1 hypothetical protein (macronuclear) [Paramecium tetraurelia strain d4-2]